MSAPADLAADLTGRRPDAVVAVAGGANSRVFRVEAGPDRYALKLYPAGDGRDRRGTEWAALTLCHHHGLTALPRPLARHPVAECALYEWIEGSRPAASVEVVTAMADLTEALGRIAVPDFAPASAACFSRDDAVAQLQARRRRLDAGALAPALAGFLAGRFDPLAARVLARPERAITPPEGQTLSPSDFGPHNMLRRPSGELVFLDLEYFGRDDAAKMVADVLLHPGAALSPALAEAYRCRATACFAARDPDFPRRLAVFRPVLALVWSLIVLNPFLPGAAAGRGPQPGLLAQRLARADALCTLAEEDLP